MRIRRMITMRSGFRFRRYNKRKAFPQKGNAFVLVIAFKKRLDACFGDQQLRINSCKNLLKELYDRYLCFKMAAVDQCEAAVLRLSPDAVLAVTRDEYVRTGGNCIENQIAAASGTPCDFPDLSGIAAFIRSGLNSPW